MAEEEVDVEAEAEVEAKYASPALLEFCMKGLASSIKNALAEEAQTHADPVNDLKSEKHNWSLLQVAAGYGKVKAVHVLLEHGAKPSVKDSMGLTALHSAANKEERDVMVALLQTEDGKACVDAQDEDGCTALHYAASGGSKAVVTALINAGASDQVVNRDGKTASDLANEYGHAAVAELIANGPQAEETGAGDGDD